MSDERGSLRGPVLLIGTVSAVAVAFLFWLLYFRQSPAVREGLGWLPALNAAFNGSCAVCLGLGYRAIRTGRQSEHQRRMLVAFLFSSLFLVSYIVYHALHGDTKFPGQGLVRPVYFAILISHVGLSMVALPMVLTTFYLALTQRWETHRKLARWTFPIWLYVSITGVLVFALLKAYAS